MSSNVLDPLNLGGFYDLFSGEQPSLSGNTFSFPYFRTNGSIVPVVFCELRGYGGTTVLPAVVDHVSANSVFPRSAAEKIGVECSDSGKVAANINLGVWHPDAHRFSFGKAKHWKNYLFVNTAAWFVDSEQPSVPAGWGVLGRDFVTQVGTLDASESRFELAVASEFLFGRRISHLVADTFPESFQQPILKAINRLYQSKVRIMRWVWGG